MFKYIVGIFIFIFFGVFQVFADETPPESSGSGLIYTPPGITRPPCPAPWLPGKCWEDPQYVAEYEASQAEAEQFKNIDNIYISKEQLDNIPEKTQNKVLKDFNTKFSGYYAYTNNNGEIIVFNHTGYCNTFTSVCYNAKLDSIGGSSSYTLEHKDFIIFITANSDYKKVFIYSKKFNKYFALDFDFYVKQAIDGYNQGKDFFYKIKTTQSIIDFSFDIFNDELRIYKSNSNVSFTDSHGVNNKYDISVSGFVIDLKKIRDNQSVFDNKSKIVSFSGNFVDNEIFNPSGKYYNQRTIGSYNTINTYNVIFFEQFGRSNMNNIVMSVYNYKDINDFTSNRYVDFYDKMDNYIDLGFYPIFYTPNDSIKLYDTYINGKGRLKEGGANGYIYDSGGLYINQNNHLTAIYYNKTSDGTIVTTKQNIGINPLFFLTNEFGNLQVKSKIDSDTGKPVYYVSYVIKTPLNKLKYRTIKLNRIYDMASSNSNFEILEDLYYLGNFNKKDFFVSSHKSIYNEDIRGYRGVTPYIVGRSGNNLNFFYFNSGVYKESNIPLFNHSFILHNYFQFGQGIIIDSFAPGVGGQNQNSDGSYQSGHQISDSEKDDEKGNIVFDKIKEKITGYFSGISEIFEFFVLPFPQEKETYSVTIPFISISKNNEINYKKLTADLPNFDDYNSLNVINVKDSDNNSLGKKFLSFLLGVFYILIRFVLVLFFFLPFILFYFIAEKLTSFLFGGLGHNSGGSSVIGKVVFWVYFATLYVPLVAIILGLFIFIPMFNIGMDYLNSVFGYILSNYLDYTFFLWFVNGFFIFLSVGIVSHFVYIIYKNN